MKLWIVTTGPEYEGHDEVTAFDSKEAAEAYAETTRNPGPLWRRWTQVEEITLNEIPLSQVPPPSSTREETP